MMLRRGHRLLATPLDSPAPQNGELAELGEPRGATFSDAASASPTRVAATRSAAGSWVPRRRAKTG